MSAPITSLSNAPVTPSATSGVPAVPLRERVQALDKDRADEPMQEECMDREDNPASIALPVIERDSLPLLAHLLHQGRAVSSGATAESLQHIRVGLAARHAGMLPATGDAAENSASAGAPGRVTPGAGAVPAPEHSTQMPPPSTTQGAPQAQIPAASSVSLSAPVLSADGEGGSEQPGTPIARAVVTAAPPSLGTGERSAIKASLVASSQVIGEVTASAMVTNPATRGSGERTPSDHAAGPVAHSRDAGVSPAPIGHPPGSSQGRNAADHPDATATGHTVQNLPLPTGSGKVPESAGTQAGRAAPAVPPAPTEGVRQMAGQPAASPSTITIPFQSWGERHSVIGTWSPAGLSTAGLQAITLRGTSSAVTEAMQTASAREGGDLGTWRIAASEQSGDAPQRRAPPPPVEEDA